MSTAASRSIVPAYLFACLVAGGSAQGIWNHAFLQITGLCLVTLILIDRRRPPMLPAVWSVVAFAGALSVLMLSQLLPLPPDIWHRLPGRETVVQLDRLLDAGPLWRPISLAPDETVASWLALVPAIAVFCGFATTQTVSRRGIVWAGCAAMIIGLGLAILQSTDSPQSDQWYLYPRRNTGVATGLFANRNHMAAFLLCVIPIAAAVFSRSSMPSLGLQQRLMRCGAAVLAIGLALAGLAINRSSFGLIMAGPVLLASMLMALRHWVSRRTKVLLTGFVLIVSLVGTASTVVAMSGSDADRALSVSTRADLGRNSWHLAMTYFPVGSGFGTYQAVYPQIENPATVDRFYVNHAHNDYLEVFVEGGVLAAALMAAFLLWWARQLLSLMRDRRADGFAFAGALICGILMIHSVVDYPLRTPALSAMFAASLALMLRSRWLPRQRSDLRPARHDTIN